jgi:hypothetical protein
MGKWERLHRSTFIFLADAGSPGQPSSASGPMSTVS